MTFEKRPSVSLAFGPNRNQTLRRQEPTNARAPMTDNNEAQIPNGIPQQQTLVLVQVDGKQAIIRGVFTSFDDVVAHLENFLAEYLPESGDKVTLIPLAKSNGDTDRVATSKVVVVRKDRRVATPYQVWDSATKARSEASLKLFWCMTEDHDEDWFMVAHSAREAAGLHEGNEGYDIGDAEVEYLMDLPVGIRARDDEDVGWPVDETLIACGAKFVQKVQGQPRVIKLNGRTFSEGAMDSVVEAVRASRSVGQG